MYCIDFRVGGGKTVLAQRDILLALRKFDRDGTGHVKRKGTRYSIWHSGKPYSIWHSGKPYPPKRILSLATGRPICAFSGGHETNRVFRELGFVIVKNHELARLENYGLERLQHGFGRPVPTLQRLLRRLFSQKWSPLTTNFRAGKDGRFPGVYLLAHTNRRLKGKPVRADDVFYVGMSNTSLSTRLDQFYKGVKKDCCHSAAMRFFRRWGNKKPYSHRRLGKSFFVAAVTVPCETEKGLRVRDDLRKMGRIAELEYAALAEIRNLTGFEPLLNKK